MGYDAALNKAWDELVKSGCGGNSSVRFLSDEYTLSLKEKKVYSLSCNVPAKEFLSVLILHYLIQKLRGLPAVTGEWLTFRELAGIEGYFSAFRKRAVEPLVRKYGKNPEGLFQVLGRLPSRKIPGDEPAVEIEAFEGVPVLVRLFRPDEEFGPDANMYFDKSVTGIFCIEDIVVLAGLIAAGL